VLNNLQCLNRSPVALKQILVLSNYYTICNSWSENLTIGSPLGWVRWKRILQQGSATIDIDNLYDINQFVSRISQNEDNIAFHETRLNDVEVAVRTLRNEAEATMKVNDLIIKVPMTADEKLTGLYCKIATALGYSPA
jgi:hypothetical protein